MRRSRLLRWILAVAAFMAPWLAGAAPAWACAVCQGNKDSQLSKGADAGVLVMVIVTYAVLLGFAAVGGVWFVRARRSGV
ncbi:MAG: hypothetical protein ACE5F9_03175 [Phycisphaerae bacterium]